MAISHKTIWGVLSTASQSVTNQYRSPLATLTVLVAAALLTAACSSSETSNSVDAPTTPAQTIYDAISTSPLDIMSEFVQRSVGTLPSTPNPNLLVNGNFESDTTGWTGCNSGNIGLSTNAYDGNNALKVSGKGCFYQSVEALPGEEVVLSCYARVVDKNIWTGMGLGFSDAAWNTVFDSPATVVSGSSYARYDVRAVAPAGASFATMWFYSETAALIDNCTLLPASEVPNPPVVNSENLLENGEFDDVTNNLPDNWQQGCFGEAYVSTTDGENDLFIEEESCMFQSLSASDIAAMQGNVFELACDIGLNTNRYASISLNLDGVETISVVPTNQSSVVRLTVLAPENTTSGFVSLYSEAGPSGTRVRSCKLTQETVEPNNNGYAGDNLLLNGSFDALDANDKPQGWAKECAGTWDGIDSPFSSAALELNDFSCVKQVFNSDVVSQLSENQYTLNCDAWNFGSLYAAVDFKVNGNTLIRHNIENTGYYEPVSFTGEMTYLTDAEILIYTGDGLRIDNCILEVQDLSTQPTNVASLDVRVNIEGRDVYSVSGPYTFDVSITNNGDLSLTDVTYSATDLACEGTVGNLQPGQSVTAQCSSDTIVERNAQTSFYTEVTANGIAPDGSDVSNTDGAGYTVGNLRPNSAGILSIRAKSRKVSPGDDAIFIVSAAATGNVSGLATIESSHTACEKTYLPAMALGEFDVYECIIPNVQNDLVVTVDAVFGLGAYKQTRQDTASVIVE